MGRERLCAGIAAWISKRIKYQRRVLPACANDDASCGSCISSTVFISQRAAAVVDLRSETA